MRNTGGEQGPGLSVEAQAQAAARQREVAEGAGNSRCLGARASLVAGRLGQVLVWEKPPGRASGFPGSALPEKERSLEQ